MRKLFSILSFILLYVTFAYGQAAVDIPLTGSDGSSTIPLAVGLDLTATNCVDPALGESDLPPLPPAGVFDIRFDLTNYGCPGLNGVALDFRAPGDPPAFPFTGTIQHTITYQLSAAGLAVTIGYDLPTGAAMRITDQIGGSFLNIGPFTGTGTATIPASYTAIFNKAYLLMDYTNIGPSGPAPVFTIAPPSLDFGSVAIGNNSTLQATVTNTGTADLSITNITSSDAEFTFSPNTFPITIAAGNNQVFDVTFAPTSGGPHSATLTFTHNATGSPTTYNVQGVGIDAGPTFSINHTSLNFGNVNVGTFSNLTVTVTNTGATNTLVISSAAIAAPEFTVSPANASIAPGGNQIFTVTFTPPAAGPYTGTLVFTDNAPGSPHNVALSGNGYIPPAEFGLIFEKDTVTRLENASYMDVMQLKALNANLKALQFRLLVNQSGGDTPILTFQNIQKGSNLSDPSWVLDYNVVRGPILPNGASVDVIYVLVYNINQGPGWALGPGDWNDLLHVNYRVANLPAGQNNIRSTFKITNAAGSQFDGTAIDITPSRDILTVIAKNTSLTYGDVNGDGCLDILDLIMVVDHITGRDTLTGDFFTRADIAPWAPGTPAPTPDGFVNVQDLALIQNIILTGFYPDGTPLNCDYGVGMPKVTDADAKITLYISNDGISAYLDSKVAVRGAQIEFGNLSNNPGNLVINTPLGDGFYYKVNDLLRTLMYDRLASKYIEAGEHFMADMPFAITNPKDITVDKIILVDLNRNKIENVQVEIIYGNAPSLPLDYILFQNYPNPFNPATTVRFQVPQTSNVTVKIYNMLGQEIRTLFAGQVQRGNYSVQWDGMNDAGVKMSSGTYIYRMNAGEFVQSKKMVLLK